MDKSVLGAMQLFVTMLLAGILAAFCFKGVQLFLTKSSISEKEIKELVVSVDERGLALMDQQKVLGSVVVDYVNRYNSVFPILITTALEPGGFYTMVGVADSQSNHFVRGNLEFDGKVVRRANGTILGLQFTQEGTPETVFNEKAAQYAGEAVQMDKQLALLQFKLDPFVFQNKSTFAQIAELEEEVVDQMDQCRVVEAGNSFNQYRESMSLKAENATAQQLSAQIKELRASLEAEEQQVQAYEQLLKAGDVTCFPTYVGGQDTP